jgi:hypothetical protein
MNLKFQPVPETLHKESEKNDDHLIKREKELTMTQVLKPKFNPFFDQNTKDSKHKQTKTISEHTSLLRSSTDTKKRLSFNSDMQYFKK